MGVLGKKSPDCFTDPFYFTQDPEIIMGMDETSEKSMATEENLKNVEGDLEEGEIVNEGGEEETTEIEKSIAKSHPLENSWTFWFDTPAAKSMQKTWGSSNRLIYTFSTVEQFWSLYNNIHPPSRLAQGADFYCFKHTIEPKWEDPICANGGKWTVTYPRGKSDHSWLNTLLAMIGEQFDHGDEICGAVVNVRARQDKISLWTKDAPNEAAQLSVGRQWKKFLDYNETTGFIFHDDAQKLDKGAKNKYTC